MGQRKRKRELELELELELVLERERERQRQRQRESACLYFLNNCERHGASTLGLYDKTAGVPASESDLHRLLGDVNDRVGALTFARDYHEPLDSFFTPPRIELLLPEGERARLVLENAIRVKNMENTSDAERIEIALEAVYGETVVKKKHATV